MKNDRINGSNQTVIVLVLGLTAIGLAVAGFHLEALVAGLLCGGVSSVLGQRRLREMNRLALAINEMYEAQEAGDIDFYLAEDRYSGGYRQMAAHVNGLVRQHVDFVLKLLGLVRSYAEGDFSPVLEKMEGKKVVANQAADLLRNNLVGIQEEISTLIEAGKAGRLKVRGRSDRFVGDWQRLVVGMNEMLDSLLDPIAATSAALERLAKGDLRARVTGDYQGDHGTIVMAVNETAQSLHDALNQVANAVEQVSSASEQIAAGSQTLAEGASEQASGLEETSSSMEEMAAMTKQNADNAQQANGLVLATKAAADRGGHSMGQMTQAMGDIRKSAEATSQIIKDINDIAFQTNLLALNAAVEAARAGDAGRGFAVVAEEVHNLAQRSKEAAKKTEELIKESMGLAENGATLSQDMNKDLREILEAIEKVTQIAGEITASSQEQSRGIEQVNRAIAQMDKVTQQNAANAEESASASEELASQAQELAALIGRFQLERTTHHPTTIRRTPVKAVASTRPATTSLAPKTNGLHLRPEEIIPLDEDPEFRDF